MATWQKLRGRDNPQQAANRIFWYLMIEFPPVDVVGIASAIGVDVLYRKDPGWSGALRSSSSGEATIWINEAESMERRRFTVAHLIGHLILHQIGEEFREGMFSGSLQETEANRFAVELLAPLWMVEGSLQPWKFWNRTSIAQLSRAFMVGETVIDVQISRLAGVDVVWR